jgi:formylmethanofuran dehydrogenase subunit E
MVNFLRLQSGVNVSTCSRCGEVGVLRPYGVNGEMICLKCQIKPK